MDANGKGTRGHSCKLLKTWYTGNITNKVTTRWNLLDQRMIDATSINAFKSRLVYTRDNRAGFFTDSPLSPRPYWLDDLPYSEAGQGKPKLLKAARDKFQRRILGVSWKNKVLNEEVREKTSLRSGVVVDGVGLINKLINIGFG